MKGYSNIITEAIAEANGVENIEAMEHNHDCDYETVGRSMEEISNEELYYCNSIVEDW